MMAAGITPASWACAECAAGPDGGCTRPARRCRVDAELVLYRLEEAGRTILALSCRRVGPAGYGSGWPDIVREAVEAYGYNPARARRMAIPSPVAISRMDEAWTWLGLLPRDRHVLRRIVGARAMVSPATDRHLFSWRHVARTVGADHKAVQRWHAQAIDLIVEALRPVNKSA